MIKVTTTSITQTGNEMLGRADKTTYYVVIDDGKEKVVIRCGEENHKKLQTMLNTENKKGGK